MKKIVENQTLDEERALYALSDSTVLNCTFAGPADGESALKECRNVKVKNCKFSLRYPLWHAENFSVENCEMDTLTRAALWYCRDGEISESALGGIKALRECENVTLSGCAIDSPEFGWRCKNIQLYGCKVKAEYFMFECENLKLKNVEMAGKYSFQYVENATVENCRFDTKDAFWHCKNVTVKNSVLRGEYLGWYSDGLTLIDCTIIGTQPLCYCKNLTLVNCKTEGCDLAFEYSDVNATVDGHIISVKNPKSGKIEVGSVDEIIRGGCVTECNGEIIIKGNCG